jgi:hypothetical protein
MSTKIRLNLRVSMAKDKILVVYIECNRLMRYSELRISVALLENIALLLLRLTENERDPLLTLSENRFTLIENSSPTSASAHSH